MAKAKEGAEPQEPPEEARVLSEEEEAALFSAYKKNPTEQNLETIIEQYKKLVYYIVRKYFLERDSFEDLVQVGLTGLLLAINRFEPERKIRFTTYAFRTVRGEIQRYLRDKSWSINVPRSLKERSLRVLTAQNKLTLKLGVSPTAEQIAEEAGLSTEEVLEALEIGSAYHPLQIIDEVVPAQFEISEDEIERELSISEEGRDIIWEQLLSYLSKTEALVIKLRFWDGLPQREVAQKLGTTQMNVSRIQRQALAKLRKVVDFGAFL